MPVTVNMDPLLGYVARAAQAIPALRRRMEQAVQETADEMKEDARAAAPQGPTGDLKGSIQARVSGLSGEVFTDLRYAPFVEFGTYKDPVQPFLLPAGDRQQRKYPARMRLALTEVARRHLG